MSSPRWWRLGASGWMSRLDPRLRPASRANEVASLRLRLLAELDPHEASEREVELARRLRALRERMLEVVSDVESCRSCAAGYPRPNGRWDGGYCCGGVTENLFRQEEIACLRAAGTRPRDLRPPAGDHAGCAFRGADGCSLAPAHRPNLCVRYACRLLDEELRRRGMSSDVRALASEMQRLFAEYQKVRAERIDDDDLAQIEQGGALRGRSPDGRDR